MIETVVITIGGRRIADFLSVSVRGSAEQAVRSAVVAVPLSVARGLRFGMPATITASGEPVITGYLRDRDRRHDGNGGSEAVITIASQTADLVEGSIDHPTGYVEGADLAGIAKAFGAELPIRVEAKLSTIDYHQIVPGESVHDTIEQLARREGVLIYDTGEGGLVLADKPVGRHAGGLRYGVNLLSASAMETEQGRHDETIVRGQSAKGHGAAALRIEARATDGEVKRRRPRIIIHEGDAGSVPAAKRAEWEARRAAGRSIRAQCTVPGWRDAGGVLWTPNRLVYFDDELLELQQDMVVSGFDFRQDDGGGTTTTLELVDPRAFGGEDPKGSSAAPAAAPSAKATVKAE